MYCPSCGTQNGDTSRFCMKCGTALPVSLKPVIQAQPAPGVTSMAWSGWRSVGVIALIGGIVSVLAFFMSWLTTPAINLGGPSLTGQINGWALFRVPFDLLGSLSQSRGGNFASGLFDYLPADVKLFLIVYVLDSALLILAPIMGIAIAVNSWKMLQSTDDATGKTRQRRNKQLATTGLVPPIVLLVLVIVLVLALSNSYDRSNNLGTALRLIDFGFWLTMASLALVLLAGPLAAPKQK